MKKTKAPDIDLVNASQLSLTNMFAQAAQFNQSPITSFDEIIRNNIYTPITINRMILTYLFKTHGTIQTAIEVPVLDALRGGVDIHEGEFDVDNIHALQDRLQETSALDVLARAMTWARLYGGGAVIINTGFDPATPLTEKQLKYIEFYDCNRWELFNTAGWNPDLKAHELLKFAPLPSDYFYFYGQKIHKSRVLILTGKAAPDVLRWQLQGWGLSEVERMIEDFNKYLRTNEALYQFLREAKIDVYKLDNYKALLAAGKQAQIYEQVTKTNQLKSFCDAIVMDKNDDFEQKQLTISELSNIMKENRIGIASAMRMPMTKLYGLSASGLNAGEEDIENYNSMVESEVRTKLRRPIKKILELLSLAEFGEVFNIRFDFKALRVLGAVEEEQVKTSKHTRFMSLYQANLITSHELGQMQEKENLISIKTAMADGKLEDHPISEMIQQPEAVSEKKEKPKKDGAK